MRLYSQQTAEERANLLGPAGEPLAHPAHSTVLPDGSDICVLPTEMFYPDNWNEAPVAPKQRRKNQGPVSRFGAELPEETVAVHRWMAEWKT